MISLITRACLFTTFENFLTNFKLAENFLALATKKLCFKEWATNSIVDFDRTEL